MYCIPMWVNKHKRKEKRNYSIKYVLKSFICWENNKYILFTFFFSTLCTLSLFYMYYILYERSFWLFLYYSPIVVTNNLYHIFVVRTLIKICWQQKFSFLFVYRFKKPTNATKKIWMIKSTNNTFSLIGFSSYSKKKIT